MEPFQQTRKLRFAEIFLQQNLRLEIRGFDTLGKMADKTVKAISRKYYAFTERTYRDTAPGKFFLR